MGQHAKAGASTEGHQESQSRERMQGRVRLPISPELMLQLKENWQRRKGFDATMLWAATCLCFFGCLRAGEVTAPERGKFDPKAHLTFDDVTVDRAEDPTRL